MQHIRNFIRKYLIEILFATAVVTFTAAIFSASSLGILCITLPVITFQYLVWEYFIYRALHSQRNAAEKMLYITVRVLPVMILLAMIVMMEGSLYLFLFVTLCVLSALVVGYMSFVRYRGYIAFLLIIIPGVVYAVRKEEIPVIYMGILLCLYFIFMLHCRRNQLHSRANLLSQRSFYQLTGIVSVVLLITVLLLPKASNTPFDILTGSAFSFSTRNNLERFTSQSGGAPVSGKVDETVLMRVDAGGLQTPLYFKRQVMGTYDREKNRFYELKDAYLQGVDQSWPLVWRDLDYEQFLRLLHSAMQLEPERLRPWNTLAERIPNITEETRSIFLYMRNFSPVFIPATLRTYQVVGLPEYLQSARNKLGELIVMNGMRVEANTGFTLICYEEILRSSPELQAFVKGFDLESYFRLLKEMKAIFMDQGQLDSYFEIETFYEEARDARRYHQYTQQETGSRIQALTAEILKGKTGDFEKALAIEQYFYQQGFTYDVSASPLNGGDVEYFLFESQKGSCSDYAAAMTLMAREAGLPTRYVEGFVTGERSKDGLYDITAKQSHAYPEVFISGYGWMTFEPTVSREDLLEQPETVSEYLLMAVLAVLIAVVALIAWLSWNYLIPHWKERRFRTVMQKRPPAQGIIEMYLRIQQCLTKQNHMGADCMTPEELWDVAKENYGFSLDTIIPLFQKSAYGLQQIAPEEYQKACRQYAAFSDCVKNIGKKGVKTHGTNIP